MKCRSHVALVQLMLTLFVLSIVPACQRVLDYREDRKWKAWHDQIEEMDELRRKGDLEKAAKVGEEVVAFAEEEFGPGDPNRVRSRLGFIYMDLERHDEAEAIFRRLLAFQEKADEPDQHRMVGSLTVLADICRRQKRYEEAESLCVRALAICEKSDWPKGFQTPSVLREIARLHLDQENYAEAEVAADRALAICEDPESRQSNWDLMSCLTVRARIYEATRRMNEAAADLAKYDAIQDAAKQGVKSK